MLLGDDLPEFSTDLVTALAGLQVGKASVSVEVVANCLSR